MIGTMQPKVLAAFYEKVFGRPADMVEDTWYTWGADNFGFSIGEHSEATGMTKEPVRVIWNFETTDVKGEYERLIGIGARSIKEPYEISGAWIATLADPDGNYFQLMTPWEG